MKRLLIAMSILLIASLSLNLILFFAGSKQESRTAAVEALRQPTKPVATRPEGVRMDRHERALERLRNGRTVENRINLEKAVQKQSRAELTLLRELAVEEEAVKTTEAIDRLLASKDKRLEQIVNIEERESRERSRLLRDREQRRRNPQEKVESSPDTEDIKTQEDITDD